MKNLHGWNPKQVAKVACYIWGLDAYYGSDYEVIDEKFTGKIISHLGEKGKVFYLKEYCDKYETSPKN